MWGQVHPPLCELVLALPATTTTATRQTHFRRGTARSRPPHSIQSHFKKKFKIPKGSLGLWLPSGILFFFLSDCGPSTAVANTLYCGWNKNLCVPGPASGWSRAGGGGGREQSDIWPLPCVMDDLRGKKMRSYVITIPPIWGRGERGRSFEGLYRLWCHA